MYTPAYLLRRTDAVPQLQRHGIRFEEIGDPVAEGLPAILTKGFNALWLKPNTLHSTTAHGYSGSTAAKALQEEEYKKAYGRK